MFNENWKLFLEFLCIYVNKHTGYIVCFKKQEKNKTKNSEINGLYSEKYLNPQTFSQHSTGNPYSVELKWPVGDQTIRKT